MVLILGLSRGFAQKPEEIEGDRPDYTESALTVPAGSLQMEGGYTCLHKEKDRERSLGELLLRFGIYRGWEMRLGLNSYVWQEEEGDRTSGKDDFSAGCKIQLFRASENASALKPDAALIGMLYVPSGSEGYQREASEGEVKLSLAWDLRSGLALGINLNYAYPREEGIRYHSRSASLVLTLDITDTAALFAEYFGLYPENREGPSAHYSQGGMTVRILKNTQLDVRGGLRWKPGGDEYFGGAGFVARWDGFY